ncbi:OmpA family protein [Nereida sp. MMG024]|nr:OmpA family protein [Nereida sp. MMG025]
MGEDVALEGTVLREADLDQIEQRLTDTGLYTSVALTRAEPRFNDGDLRPNALTGRDEVYQNGFWVPVVDISNATANLCDDATRAVFEGQSINFVTGSAQLDATSRSVIAELAGLVTTCFAQNAELTVIVQGHTDSVGSAESNQLLSRDRANAVVAALAERGIENARLTSIGFGESRPIADNDTEEGRAENRRTVLVWRD